MQWHQDSITQLLPLICKYKGKSNRLKILKTTNFFRDVAKLEINRIVDQFENKSCKNVFAIVSWKGAIDITYDEENKINITSSLEVEEINAEKTENFVKSELIFCNAQQLREFLDTVKEYSKFTTPSLW